MLGCALSTNWSAVLLSMQAQRYSCASSAIFTPNRYNFTDPLELLLQGADVGVCIMVAGQNGNDIV
jgi:hypothetical protein